MRSMATDDERRRVAERLRGLDYSDLQESLICAYLDALGIKGYEDWIGIAHRLADLIEPSIPEDPGEAGLACVDAFIREHTEKPVDRDALLELADEIEDNDLTYCVSTQYVLDSYARRIREACGMVDAG